MIGQDISEGALFTHGIPDHGLPLEAEGPLPIMPNAEV
jgi:hypothetical protein